MVLLIYLGDITSFQISLCSNVISCSNKDMGRTMARATIRVDIRRRRQMDLLRDIAKGQDMASKVVIIMIPLLSHCSVKSTSM